MIGSSAETLLWSEMPSHNHAASWGSTAERTDSPVGAIWTNTAGRRGGFAYTDYAPGTVEPMNAQEAGAAGGGQPHNNMQPFLALNFIIALEGIFPPRG
jgi:microcystin-dependent protein